MKRIVLKEFEDEAEYWEWQADMENLDRLIRIYKSQYPTLRSIELDVDNIKIIGYLAEE